MGKSLNQTMNGSKLITYEMNNGSCIVNFLTGYCCWHYYKEHDLQSRWVYILREQMNIVHVGIKILHWENCGLICSWTTHEKDTQSLGSQILQCLVFIKEFLIFGYQI